MRANPDKNNFFEAYSKEDHFTLSEYRKVLEVLEEDTLRERPNGITLIALPYYLKATNQEISSESLFNFEECFEGCYNTSEDYAVEYVHKMEIFEDMEEYQDIYQDKYGSPEDFDYTKFIESEAHFGQVIIVQDEWNCFIYRNR